MLGGSLALPSPIPMVSREAEASTQVFSGEGVVGLGGRLALPGLGDRISGA